MINEAVIRIQSAILCGNSGCQMQDQKGIDHTYLEKFSLPAVVIAKNGEVLWYNARFKRKLADGKDCAGELIDHYICGEDIETLLLKDGTDIVYENRCYTVLATEINYGYVLYYVDDTDNKQAAKLYNDTKPVVASVNLDNRDEFERDITDDNINQAMVQIESIIKKTPFFRGAFSLFILQSHLLSSHKLPSSTLFSAARRQLKPSG